MGKWEYKIIAPMMAPGRIGDEAGYDAHDAFEELKKLGLDGWELVDVVKLSGDEWVYYNLDQTAPFILFLKRELT